jgi:hypothetical protein
MTTYRPYEPLKVTIPAGSDVSGPIDISDKALFALEVPDGNSNTFAVEVRSLLNPVNWLAVTAAESPSENQIRYTTDNQTKTYPLGTIRLKLDAVASSALTVALHLKS